MSDAVIVGARRTAVGKFGGSLAAIPASGLGAKVLAALIDETGIDPSEIDEVIMGQVLAAAAGQNPARQASIEAGLPHEVPALTINKVCGSGLKAVGLASQAIRCGDALTVLAGGQENMSMAPHALVGSREGRRMGDWPLVDTMIRDGLWDAFNDVHMGNTAENVSEQFGVSREDQDAFAAASQQKSVAAIAEGRLRDQIVPVEIPQRKGPPIVFDTDEFPRDGTTAEALAHLRPAFDKQGTVTAGNASGLNDGAAACVVMSADEANRRELAPLGRIAAFASAGVDPRIMGTGPIPATRRCLEKAGWTAADLDLIEANEAFAAQATVRQSRARPGYRQGQRERRCDRSRPSDRCVRCAHPCRPADEMRRRDAHRGLATLCIGGGQGVALAVERAV